MCDYAARFKNFLRSGNPYKRAMYLAFLLVMASSALGLASFLPNADEESVCAGLTIIVETVGVLLGAVLVVTGFLVEQGQQAQSLLIGIGEQYRHKISSRLDEIDAIRQGLVERIKSGKVQLDEPVLGSGTTYRDTIGLLSKFNVVMRGKSWNRIEGDLRDLGYSEKEAHDILYSATSVNMQPDKFLLFLRDALAEAHFALIASGLDLPTGIRNLTDPTTIVEDQVSSGVYKAIGQLKRSQTFRRSAVLSINVTLSTLTIVLGVMVLFGVTKDTVYVPAYGSYIVLIVVGFMLSVILTISLIGRMLM